MQQHSHSISHSLHAGRQRGAQCVSTTSSKEGGADLQRTQDQDKEEVSIKISQGWWGWWALLGNPGGV